MKVITRIPGTEEIAFQERPEPEITQPDEIKVKVLQVGVDSRDLSLPEEQKIPLILGKEVMGQVVEIGSEVHNLAIGDYIAITACRGCGHCVACVARNVDMCTSSSCGIRGLTGLDGFQAEFIVEREFFAVKIPTEIIDVGVLLGPLAVITKAMDEASAIQKARLVYLRETQHWLSDRTVLIVGLNLAGLLAALVARLRGAMVIGLDSFEPQHKQAQLLLAAGGTYIWDQQIQREKLDEYFPEIDLIVASAPIARREIHLLNILETNGIAVLTGKEFSLDETFMGGKLMIKNQVLMGSSRASVEHYQGALRDLDAALRHWPGLLPQFITRQVPHEESLPVLRKQDLDFGEIKTVVNWS